MVHVSGKKLCTSCRCWVNETDFSKSKSSWDGLRPSCKTCTRNNRLLCNPNMIPRRTLLSAEKLNNYDLSNRKHKPRIAHSNGSKFCVYCKIWLPLNSFSAHGGCWDKLNPYCKPCANDRRRKQRNTWYNSNIKRRLYEQYRLRLLSALKHGNAGKSNPTIKLLGCSVNELKQYLERQFQPGMTWDNHTINGWHIDHIQPCSVFDFTDPEQQRICFNYNNLQPLWAKDNLSKSGPRRKE